MEMGFWTSNSCEVDGGWTGGRGSGRVNNRCHVRLGRRFEVSEYFF